MVEVPELCLMVMASCQVADAIVSAQDHFVVIPTSQTSSKHGVSAIRASDDHVRVAYRTKLRWPYMSEFNICTDYMKGASHHFSNYRSLHARGQHPKCSQALLGLTQAVNTLINRSSETHSQI